jgi:hypothetical protein
MPINPADFVLIPRMREAIKTLPEDIRFCSTHGEETTLQEGRCAAGAVGVAPFKEAYWVGCCEEAIMKAMNGVRETLEQIDCAKQIYKDELAPQLEPEHIGEIVAIELGTNNYFVGENELAASNKARNAGHEGALFFLRVGSPYAHRLMTPRQ